MTGYVTTRWYRAPEIILSWMKYDSKGMYCQVLLSMQYLIKYLYVISGYVVSWLYNGRTSYWTSFI